MDVKVLSSNGDRIAQIVFASVFTMGIILSNILLIGTIVCKKELRQNSKYILVMLLALTDLYLGIVVYPLGIHIQLTQRNDLSCLTRRAMQGSIYIKNAMNGLGIVSVKLDHILQSTARTYMGSYRIIGVTILSMLFIGGPLVVFIPMFIVGGTDPCSLDLEPSYAKVTLLLSCWAPKACVLIATIFVSALHLRPATLIPYQTQDQTSSYQPPAQKPTDMILAATLTVLLAVPEGIYSTGSVFGEHFDWNYKTVLVLEYFAHSRAFLVPMIWFVKKELRNTLLRRGRGDQPLMSGPASTDHLDSPTPSL